MKLAFYRGRYGTLADWAIILWTMGLYSHVELVFSNGTSFSSSGRDGGARFAEIGYSHKERWEFVKLDIDGEEEKEIWNECKRLIGKKYDWLGIFFHQFLPLNTQDDDKWWCSEIVAYILGILPFRISPNKLYNAVIGK